MKLAFVPVLERLLEDDYVHEQLVNGTQRLAAGVRRARALRAEEAVRDQKLYDHVRAAAASLQEAARRALGAEPEPPPRRRGRRVAALAILAGVGALVRSMHRAQQTASPVPTA